MSDVPQDPRDPGDETPPSSAPFDSGESTTPPEDSARWQRPVERFPALPSEAPTAVPLKEPPRPARVAARRTGKHDGLGNVVALFFLLASCMVVTYFALIWQNPYSAINPLAPPTPLPLVITTTFTPTFTLTPS